jgi:hypothetical protein
MEREQKVDRLAQLYLDGADIKSLKAFFLEEMKNKLFDLSIEELDEELKTREAGDRNE